MPDPWPNQHLDVIYLSKDEADLLRLKPGSNDGQSTSHIQNIVSNFSGFWVFPRWPTTSRHRSVDNRRDKMIISALGFTRGEFEIRFRGKGPPCFLMLGLSVVT